MPLSSVPVETFGGLNLVDDPGSVGWSGALDLRDIHLDKTGRLTTRDGWTAFVSPVSANSTDFAFLAPYYDGSGVSQLVIGFGDNTAGTSILRAYDSTAAIIHTGGTASNFDAIGGSWALLGTPTGNTLYFPWGAGLYSYDGTTFAAVAGSPSSPQHVAVQATDKRLVTGQDFAAGNFRSRVRFSGAGAPGTWGANDFVDLNPGDGETITGLVGWRDLVIAFKRSKYFVFYGNSTDSSGNSIFNYRAIDAGVGVATPGLACAGKHGVYFFSDDGIFVTTGGEPRRISRQIDPFLRAETLPFYTGEAIRFSTYHTTVQSLGRARPFMRCVGKYLYIGIQAASSSLTFQTLVYDTELDYWTMYALPVAYPIGWRPTTADHEDVFFAYLNGSSTSFGIGRHGPSYTTDNGSAITSLYRSGFSDLGSTQTKDIREWLLEGSGSPTFKVSDDFGSLDTGAAVTLGTSPAVAEGRRRYAARGRQFSWQVGGTTAWSLNNLVAQVREKRAPGTHS